MHANLSADYNEDSEYPSNWVTPAQLAAVKERHPTLGYSKSYVPPVYGSNLSVEAMRAFILALAFEDPRQVFPLFASCQSALPRAYTCVCVCVACVVL